MFSAKKTKTKHITVLNLNTDNSLMYREHNESMVNAIGQCCASFVNMIKKKKKNIHKKKCVSLQNMFINNEKFNINGKS